MCDVHRCNRPGKSVYGRRGGKPVAHLCDKHAQQRGFCIGCGVHEFIDGEGLNDMGLCLSCEMVLEGLTMPVVEDEIYQQKLFDNW